MLAECGAGPREIFLGGKEPVVPRRPPIHFKFVERFQDRLVAYGKDKGIFRANTHEIDWRIEHQIEMLGPQRPDKDCRASAICCVNQADSPLTSPSTMRDNSLVIYLVTISTYARAGMTHLSRNRPAASSLVESTSGG